MRRFIGLLFLITVFNQVDLIAQSSKNSLIRSIKFIDLKDSANAPFWGNYREVPRLIMTAIQSGSIKPFIVDYNKNSTISILSLSQYEKRIQLLQQIGTPEDAFYSQGGDYLFPSDIPYLGLDQTISIVEGRECTHIHYVNFYSHENFSEDQKNRQYCFSVTWEDFISVLKQRHDLLYTPNIYGAWWRGNVFITNERYFIESKTSDFIELSLSHNISPKDFQNLNVLKTTDSLNKKTCEPSLMDLYVIEQKKKDYWNVKRLFFGTVPQDGSYLYERRFGYEWADFTAVLENKKIATSSNIYTFEDAFLLKKFGYSDTIKPIQISKNGKFINGRKDFLCTTLLNESFKMSVTEVMDTKFHTQLLENLYLEDASNAQLNSPGHSIAEILHDNVLKGTVVAYQDDSLNKPMTIERFRANASQYLDVPGIREGSTYEKGDTLSMYINDGNYWYGETRYFIIQEKFNSTDFFNDSSFFIPKMKRYYPPLIPVEELNALELVQHMSFNHEGSNKKYELQVVALHVSADGPSNIKGIQYAICYVRWQDLKAILLKDPRATFIYKGRQVNLIDLIENREFLSILLKTGYVEIGE